MKKNRINTTSIREIKSSFKRFLSLLIMSMLGVGVFIGIKMSAPDMLMSLDKYYDDNNVYDIKIISTLGLTNEDVIELKRIKEIENVYATYSKDVLADINKSESVIKVIGITDSVNKIDLKKGRLPKNNKEIVVEEALLNSENVKIGNEIVLKDEDTFKKTKLTIVGVVKSPLYITSSTGTSNRGNTNLGTGKINYYAYVNESNFNTDYYTEIYATVNGARKKVTDGKEYNRLVNNTLDKISNIKRLREDARYREIYNKVNDEIQKEEQNGLTKLNDAKKSLDSAEVRLKTGKQELDSSKKQLDSGYVNLEATKKKLEEARIKLDNTKTLLENGKIEIENGKQEIDKKLSEYGITLDDLYKTKEAIENINKEELINNIPSDIPEYEKIVELINNLDVQTIEEQIKNLINNKEIIDKIESNVPSDIPNYEQIIKVLNYYKENQDKVIELLDALEKIENAEKEYEEGLRLYNAGESEYEYGYNQYLNYYNEYQNGLSLYNNGFRTYNSNLNLYNSKIAEYYESKNMFDLKIIEAKKALDEIPKPTWYTYQRIDDSGYSSFIDDGKSVSNLSKVFPTIFFIVAILISLISMSRMVEDDRSVIGTFKSLGFSNKHIRKKYLLYSGIATLSGGLIGALLGFFLLPRYVWNIYKILFDVPVFKYDFNPTSVIVGILIALICICGTTLLTIRKVVKEKPSDLMRPKAPTNGKRVILEKIPFIWNRINFSNKVTVRNLFRYKKRVIMTVTGILGCTALMLAGFGIRDSIVKVPDKQYKDVFTFDEMVYVASGSKEELDNIFDNKHITNKVYTNMDNKMTTDGYDVNIFVADNTKDLEKVINLKDVKTAKTLKVQDNKVIISDKLAELINKKIGDKITLKEADEKTHTFEISGICENYVGHYVFMAKNTYEKNVSSYKTNIVYLNIDNLKNEEQLSTALLKNDNVMSVMSVNSTINGVNDMLKSLNSVVLILIFLSGALSFVVLYNLSYINICERKREIATLKVLGFTDKEVDNYITKETIILTLIGIILGLIFGIILTYIIINTVEIEMVRFLRNINPSSFIITALIVMLFTLIVNKIIHYALKKIDMIESLKSVE